MVAKAYRSYLGSFRGLSREVWWLSAVMFVNRAGTMIFPFLSLYLKEFRAFTLEDIGWVMSAFGLGSFAGSWLGGKLADRFGFYPVMVYSLFTTGILFILLQFIDTFTGFAIGIFFTTVIADSFRPAAYVALDTYSKPENKTRSITLIRLAINLGFSMGPAAAGFIIAGFGYQSIFWIDGLTCMGAAVMLRFVLDSRQAREAHKADKGNSKKPQHDWPFLVFCLCIILIAFSFMQFLAALPLYYREAYQLSEETIGWLLAMNGIVIFVFEMPLIKYLEDHSRLSIYHILIGSTLTMALSFMILNTGHWFGLLVIGMLLLTFGEMLCFPFLNTFVMDRSSKGKTGAYMSFFAMAFSLGHIGGPNAGMQLVNLIGFEQTWYVMSAILILATGGFFLVRQQVKREFNSDQQLQPEIE